MKHIYLISQKQRAAHGLDLETYKLANICFYRKTNETHRQGILRKTAILKQY